MRRFCFFGQTRQKGKKEFFRARIRTRDSWIKQQRCTCKQNEIMVKAVVKPERYLPTITDETQLHKKLRARSLSLSSAANVFILLCSQCSKLFLTCGKIQLAGTHPNSKPNYTLDNLMNKLISRLSLEKT